MMRHRAAGWIGWALALAFGCGLFDPIHGEVASSVRGDEPSTLQLPGELGLPGGFGEEKGREVVYSARLEAIDGGPSGRLIVTAQIAPDWHVYSLTQKKGGPLPTKFDVTADPPLQIGGPFKPDRPPSIHRYEIWENLDVEEHAGKVEWTAPVVLPAGVDPSQWKATLRVRGQVCSDAAGCIQVDQRTPVVLKGFAAGPVPGTARAGSAGGDAASNSANGAAPNAAAPAAGPPFKPGPYRGRLSHVEWNGRVRWDFTAKPGVYELRLEAKPDRDWHVYQAADSDATGAGEGKPTMIALASPADWKRGKPQPSEPPVAKSLDGQPTQVYHEQAVVWTIPVQATSSAGGELVGLVGFQTCSGAQCDLPSGAEFSVRLPDANQNPAGELALGFRPSTYKKVVAAMAGVAAPPPVRSAAAADEPVSARTWEVVEIGSQETMTLWSALSLAFVGGFLLNFMPCVLPVIGLKIVAFVQQSQGSRRQALLLNLYYSLGLIAVFLVLAAFAAAPQWFGRAERLGWGEQFQSTTFNTVMASVVFVFALSMLGVWEIPIPGFLGSSSHGKDKEGGFWGAFAKGVFTTVMATPCTGPFMGSALTWSFGQKPPVIFATFFALGLGMALPYLVIGAFPQLMKFLPKPGAWMDTFKQIMGFVLLATVVFIFSFLKKDMIVATFGLLVGLWMACWWVGRTPAYAEWQEKVRSWCVGTIMAVVVGWLSFTYLGPSTALLPWQPFSRVELEKHLDEGKTVLVDFTADWCLTCKVNETVALNTKRTLAVIQENDVVVIKADKTEDDETSESINRLLQDLGHPDLSIPYLVIFPGDGSKPIAFSGPVTPSMVVQALRDAGPSKSTGPRVAASGDGR